MAEAPGGFDIRRILLLGGVSVVVIFSVIFLLVRGCAPAVRGGNGNITIYSNLDLKDAANVVARLKELAIPYELKDQGRSIAVSKEKADEAKIGLAEKNLPAGGVVGWEIFDETKMGATDFDRRIQLIRAISGELARTIRQIEAVEEVRVQIVMPETRLFETVKAPVTASVMLRLRPGMELSNEKINGIVHLVASSVENLQTENVTIIDDTGKILTAKALGKVLLEAMPPPPPLPMAAEAKGTEEEIPVPPLEETAVTAVSSPAAAASPEVKPEIKAIPSIEVIAPSQVITTEAALSPEERMMVKVSAKKKLEGDLAGKAQEILNRFFPLNSVIVKVNVELKDGALIKGVGQELKISKLTAIVLVDNRLDLPEEQKKSTFKIVAAAVGYNRERGDKIILQKVPFHLATPSPEQLQGQVAQALPPRPAPKLPLLSIKWLSYVPWLAGALTLVFILVLVMRRFRKGEPEKFDMSEGAPATIGAERPSSELEALRSAAESNPEKIAELLKSWLTE